MGVKKGATVLAFATAAMVALTASAAARTQTVWAGGPTGFQNTLHKAYSAEALDFFPRTVTVNVGDTISWQGMSIGFHSIDIPAKGGSDLPLILPTGAKVSGLNDFAGSPFWFNGQPVLGFNPQLGAPLGGKTYNGSSRVDSGLPTGPPTPYKITFLKPGVYEYFCDVHYDMHGFVVVQPKGKPTPSAAQNAATVAKQTLRDFKIARALSRTKIHGSRVSLGVAGKDNVEVLAMLPSTLRVKTGTTVTFAMSRLTGETHTATFGPAGYLKPLANSFNGPVPSPTALYPSSPPGTPLTLNPTSHGNGFANTGALDEDASTPLPPGAKITFTAPGTYHFVCLIHPFMRGTVVVTGGTPPLTG